MRYAIGRIRSEGLEDCYGYVRYAGGGETGDRGHSKSARVACILKRSGAGQS